MNVESVGSADEFMVTPVEPIASTSSTDNNVVRGPLGNILDRLEEGVGSSMGRVQGELLKVMDNQGAVNSSMLMLQLKVSEHAYSMSIASGVASSARQSMQSLLQNG